MSDLSETPFRVYTVIEGEQDFIGAADDASLGDLLRDARERGLTDDSTRVGILYRPVEEEPGEWIVNPWATGAGGDH